MKVLYFALFVALVCCAQLEKSYARGLISFGSGPSQSATRLASSWDEIAEDRQEKIEKYLFDLGISGTGTIQLIGVYGDITSGSLFHFQQLDLVGNRLFWSVLVNANNMSARVIYHVQAERISDSFTSIVIYPKNW